MPITIPNFTTSAVINGNTLVSQADEQFNIMMNDIKLYVQNTYNTVSSTLEGEVISSLNSMQVLYDSFDDRYLGVKTSNPTVDNDGNALVQGTLYFNSTIGDLRIYNGNTWITVTAVDTFTRNETQHSLPAIGFDTSLNNTPSVGQVNWNTEDNTLNVGLPFNVIGQMFQEYHIPVRNTTGHTLLNGRPIMAIGTTGNSGKILVEYHNGLQANTKNIIGFTTHDIPNNSDGLVTVSGKVRNINTTGSTFGETWLDGDILYIKPNTSGMLTKVVPSDTELKIPIAFIVHAHNSGTLLVRTTPIDENHDKAWVTDKLSLKADTTSVYTQAQINSLLSAINLRLEALENI